ncbi:Conserved_hypothetical protein [Hexamita inflata]|uniref:Transmembrane protein n=1 Tax=Hexamita inflata TaxID=28002 RepID=A0AA86NKT5_9EUKA|nr:Conserved hypothetical protein [Hexamita inflata]
MLQLAFCIKFGQLQQQMHHFEQTILDDSYQQYFFNVQDILNQKNLTYFKAGLLLFPDYLEHQQEYTQRQIASSLTYKSAVLHLKQTITNGNASEKIWAKERLNAIQTQFPDLNNGFILKQRQFFTQYSSYLKLLDELGAKIDLNDSFEELEGKLGTDTFFTIQQHQKLSSKIPYTNPAMLSNTPKDVVLVIKQFQDLDVLLQTIYEISSLFDRIWLFSFEKTHTVNIFQEAYSKQFLSVIQIQNNIEKIIELIQKYDNCADFIELQFINTIQNEIQANNQNYTYQFINGQQVTLVNTYCVFLIFSNDIQFTSNRQLQKVLGNNIYLISQRINNHYLLQYNKYFDLTLQYQNQVHFSTIQLKSIIKHQKEYMIDYKTVFGHINNTLIFIKPIYRQNQYIGSIYKIYEYYDQNLIYNDVNWYDQVSRVIVIDQQFNKVIIDPFAQHSPPYTTINNQRKYQFQLQLIVFNHSELQFNYTGNIRTTINQVYDNIEDDIFTEKYITVYQIKTGYADYNAIISMSNKALTMLSRVPFKECDQTLPEITLAKQQYSSHVSTQQFNISQLRSLANTRCSNNLDSLCIEKSDYFQVRSLVKQYNNDDQPADQCAFNKLDKFNFHAGFEIIFDEIKDQCQNKFLGITGNITEFSNQMLLAYSQVASGQITDLYQTISQYINIPQQNISYLLNKYLIKQNNDFSAVQFNQHVDISQQTIIPMAVFDLLYVQNEIPVLNQATYNLQGLLNLNSILEVQIGHFYHSTPDLVLKNIHMNYYDLFSSQNGVSDQIITRFNLYKKISSYFQMHYFTYSSGLNWKLIMKEQIKAQPSGHTGKYRIGIINGKVSVTKAILVDSKNLDSQKVVNGFLTVVLDKPFDLGIKENYTFIDENARYIAGINDAVYIEGFKSVLLKYRYFKQIRVNYTLNEYQNVIQTDFNFWEQAQDRAKYKEFTLVVSKEKSVFQKLLDQSEFDKSEIHQRTVIFNAKCDQFMSGQIIVKQFGAIDGVLVIYKDIVLQKNIIIPQTIEDSSNMDSLEYYYHNLTARDIKRTIQITNTNQQILTSEIIFETQETVLLSFTFAIALVLFVLIIFYNSKCDSGSYMYYQDHSAKKVINQQQSLNLSQYVDPIYHKAHQVSFESSDFDAQDHDLQLRIQMQNKIIFHQDIIYVQLNQIDLFEKRQMFKNLTYQKYIDTNYQVSFSILTTAQHYSLILNQLKKQQTHLKNNTFNLIVPQMIFTISNKSFRMPKVRHYLTFDNRNISESISVISKTQSNISAADSVCEEDEFYHKIFDDRDHFYDRRLQKPQGVQVILFQDDQNIILQPMGNQLTDILQMSINIK